MLIVIGADGNNLDSEVSKRFGHADYYIMYNTESGFFDAVKNDHIEDQEMETGEEHANLRDFLEKGVKAFIVGNIGPAAFQIIKTPETKVYLARKMNVGDAIKKFLAGELTELFGPTAKRSIGRHGKQK
ncbi:MAG: NifB/NifX family molybdenum-iron cluster-binding protein [Candidatus Kryptoniota bacterium]